MLSVGVTRLLDFVINGRRNRQWYIDRFRTANYEELLNKVPYVLRASYSDEEVVKLGEFSLTILLFIHNYGFQNGLEISSRSNCVLGHPGDTRYLGARIQHLVASTDLKILCILCF